jgi:uncharacterized protein YbaP (TraB family)
MSQARFFAGFVLALGLLAAQDNQVITLPAPPATASPQPSSHVVGSVAAVPSARSAGVRGLLWKATSGANTVYLAGSLHFGAEDMYPLPQEMESAFQESSVLVVELDVSGAGAAKAAGLLAIGGMYPAGDSLWNHVSERTRSQFPAFAADLGLNAEMLSRFKPWAVGLLLGAQMLQTAGMRTDLGIDQHFLGQARGVKRIDELETAEEQVSAFRDVPEREQVQGIEETVNDPERSRRSLKQMKAAWRDGDAAALEAVIAEEFRTSPETRKRLLDDRNARMAAALERYLKGGEPCFVVVGAGHLVGKGGVVSRLAQRGFTVKRVAPAQ